MRRLNPQVAFEMDCDHHLITADTACGHSYGFKSIIGSGTIEWIEDMEEKMHVLNILMHHQTGKDYPFENKMVETVCVFKIVSKNFSGKYHPYFIIH